MRAVLTALAISFSLILGGPVTPSAQAGPRSRGKTVRKAAAKRPAKHTDTCPDSLSEVRVSDEPVSPNELLRGAYEYARARGEIPEKTIPAIEEIADLMGVAVKQLRVLIGNGKPFKSADDVFNQAKKAYVAGFNAIPDRRIFTAQRQARLLRAVRDADNVILVKLVEGQDLGNFHEILTASKALNNAPIVFAAPFGEIGAIPVRLGYLFNHPLVHVMVDDVIEYSNGVQIVNNGVLDKVANPLATLKGVYAPTDLVIQFHRKLQTQVVPSGYYDSQPGMMITTGAMNTPAYNGGFASSIATDFKANIEAERERGVLVLSRGYQEPHLGPLIGSANGVGVRRLRFTKARFGNPEGLFDGSRLYTASGVVELKSIPAIVLGDLHWGESDPKALEAFWEILIEAGVLRRLEREEADPLGYGVAPGAVGLENLAIHDVVNGEPFNGHLEGKPIDLARLDEKDKLGIVDHFKSAAGFLSQLTKVLANTKIVIPSDNHTNDWFLKALNREIPGLSNRPSEYGLILEMAKTAIDGHRNPLEVLFARFGVNPERVKFLKPGESYRVAVDPTAPNPASDLHGVELGQHSQYGVNGAKSISTRTLALSFGAIVAGHTHATEEQGLAVRVGTTTFRRQGYHRGPSTSHQSSAIVYGPTAIQLVPLINGRYLPSDFTQSPDRFFPSADYPRMVKHRELPEGGHTSTQYRRPPGSRSR
jgi:hypothetical protein